MGDGRWKKKEKGFRTLLGGGTRRVADFDAGELEGVDDGQLKGLEVESRLAIKLNQTDLAVVLCADCKLRFDVPSVCCVSARVLCPSPHLAHLLVAFVLLSMLFVV